MAAFDFCQFQTNDGVKIDSKHMIFSTRELTSKGNALIVAFHDSTPFASCFKSYPVGFQHKDGHVYFEKNDVLPNWYHVVGIREDLSINI